MIETDKYEAWGCDPNPDWMAEVHAREAADREARAVQAAIDAAKDDWALRVAGPVAEKAEYDERCERIQRRRREIIAALDAEGPTAVSVTAYTWRVTRRATPAKTITVDRNRDERERWIDGARRRHPEWGKSPHPPRRLAPAWERRTVAPETKAATAVFVTFSEEQPKGCPHCPANGLLSESFLDEWDDMSLLGAEVYHLTVPEPWEGDGWSMDCTDIRNCADVQAQYFVLQMKTGYRGYKSRAVPL